MQYFAIMCRCLIGAVFVASSISKVAGRNAVGSFVTSVAGLRLLPAPLSRPLALLVTAGEFAVWVLLVAPVTVAAGFAVATGLLMTFTAGIALALRRGERVPCRCFGASATPLGRPQLVRNLALTLVAVAGAVTTFAGGPPARLGGVLVAIIAGLFIGTLVAVFDDLIDLFRSEPRSPLAVNGKEKHDVFPDRGRRSGRHAVHPGPDTDLRRDQASARPHATARRSR